VTAEKLREATVNAAEITGIPVDAGFADGMVAVYRGGRFMPEVPAAAAPAAGGVSAHALLDGGTAHSDAATGTPTKGDLVVGSGTLWDDLPVGANTQVLTADSAEALGVKWATPAGGTVEDYFTLGRSGQLPAGAVDDFADFVHRVPHSGTITRLLVQVKTAVAVTKTVRLRKRASGGAYADVAVTADLAVAMDGGLSGVSSTVSIAFSADDMFQLSLDDVAAASGSNLTAVIEYTH
jgi:hypothetical protein